MEGQVEMGVLFVVIMIVLGSYVMPILTAGAKITEEPLSSLDCINNYVVLWGSIDFMKPFLLSAPRDEKTNLLKDPCDNQTGVDICQTWFKGAKADFKNRLGKTFIDGLEKTLYLERHAECKGSGCPHLKNCLNNGMKAIDPEDRSLTPEKENDAILDCFQVAKYMMRRNSFLEEQARTTMQPLTNTWLEALP